MARRIELERHFTVGRQRLEQELINAFGDERIQVEQRSRGEEFHLAITTRHAQMLAELPINEHLGGGSKPVLILENHFKLHTEEHNQLDAEKIIKKVIKDCHIH